MQFIKIKTIIILTLVAIKHIFGALNAVKIKFLAQSACVKRKYVVSEECCGLAGQF